MRISTNENGAVILHFRFCKQDFLHLPWHASNGYASKSHLPEVELTTKLTGMGYLLKLTSHSRCLTSFTCQTNSKVLLSLGPPFKARFHQKPHRLCSSSSTSVRIRNFQHTDSDCNSRMNSYWKIASSAICTHIPTQC